MLRAPYLKSMASNIKVVLLRARIVSPRKVLSSTQLTKCVTILSTRGYAKNRTKNKEDLKVYNKFNTNLKASRVTFQNELKEQQASIEDFSAIAAEETRLEKNSEEKALAANKIELERMAKMRERYLVLAEKKRQNKLNRGVQARGKWEQAKTDFRTKEVLQVLRESESFITIDNLDEKINEVIRNEVDYNYALSPSGKITSQNYVKSTPHP